VLEVARLTWRHQRGALIGWSLALLALAALTIAFYPSISAQYKDVFEAMPEALREAFGGGADITTLEGFLVVEWMSYIALAYAVFAVSQGARSLAGEEQDGTLDLVLALPLGRVRVLAEKAGALLASLLVLSLASSLGFLIGGLLGGVDAEPAGLVRMGLSTWPVSVLFLSMAVLGSAAFHGRGTASLPATLYVVAAYFVDLFAPLVPGLADLRYGSVFHYFGESRPLSEGIDAVYWGGTLAASALLLAAAAALFQQKDIKG